MELNRYYSETVFEEMRRLKQVYDLPVDFVFRYLDTGKIHVWMFVEETDYWLSVWLEDKAKGRHEQRTNIKRHLAAYNSKVVAIMEEKFLKHSLPIEMTIGPIQDLKRDVTIMFVEEDLLLVSWLIMSSIDEYLLQ